MIKIFGANRGKTKRKRWLSQIVKREISHLFPELTKNYPNRLGRFFNWISHWKGGLVTLSIPILILLTAGVISAFEPPTFLTIQLGKERAQSLLTGQLSLITDLIAISFVLLGFIFTAIQLTRSDENLLPSLLKKSFLFPIAYFTFSALLSLNTLTFFSDSWGNEMFISVAGTSLIISSIVILSILFLFIRITIFFRSDTIVDIYIKELKAQSIDYLYSHAYANLAEKAYKSFVIEIGISNYKKDFFANIPVQPIIEDQENDNTQELKGIVVQSSKPYNIRDINLSRLKSVFDQFSQKELKSDFFFCEPSIYRILKTNRNLFYVSENHYNKIHRNIISSFKIVERHSVSPSPEEIFSNSQYILLQAIEEENEGRMELILDEYVKFNNEIIKILVQQQTYELKSTIPYYKGSSLYSAGIQTINENVIEAIKKAVLIENTRAVYILLRYHYNILYSAIEHDNLEILSSLSTLAKRIYQVSIETKVYQNIISKRLGMHLQELATLRLSFENREAKSIETKKLKGTQLYWIFYAFHVLLKEILDNQDLESFRIVMNEFNIILDRYWSNANESFFNIKIEKEHLENQIRAQGNFLNDINTKDNFLVYSKETDLPIHNKHGQQILIKLHEKFEKVNTDYEYHSGCQNIETEISDIHRRFKFGFFSWICYLYDRNILTAEIAKAPLNSIPLLYSGHLLFKDILFFQKKVLFDWGDWDTEKRLNHEFYSPVPSYYWLRLGLLIKYVGNENGTIDFRLHEVPDSISNKYLKDNFSQLIPKIKEETEKWLKILPEGFDKDLVIERLDVFDDFLVKIEDRREENRFKHLAEAPLSEELIQTFRASTFNQWKKSRKISSLFISKQTASFVNSSQADKLYYYGAGRITITEGKMAFSEIENSPIYGMSFGSEASKAEEYFILNKIISKKEPINSFASIKEAVDSCISRLKIKDYSPNVILLSHNDAYFRNDLTSSKDFERISGIIPEGTYLKVGNYKGLEVVATYSPILKSSGVVCQLEKAFNFVYYTNENWEDGLLRIDIKTFSRNRANELYEQKPQNWKKYRGKDITKEWALYIIMSSVLIDVASAIDFKVIDSDAYESFRLG